VCVGEEEGGGGVCVCVRMFLTVCIYVCDCGWVSNRVLKDAFMNSISYAFIHMTHDTCHIAHLKMDTATQTPDTPNMHKLILFSQTVFDSITCISL
jgi:hypothetical protein